ncbi:lipopolysaccharide biosynthesis protein [Lactiplantibacillus nangangensis]|uniref:Lipopolysaccharide biosynthesis protein n=1 Tax=Lactiplantibacillus nangangensis TaxID=2559917 RepID=A0ABW1SIS3_9LACO|nr:oligosaccharide flippase family protein [Lactiplantibacillus nangangensis]
MKQRKFGAALSYINIIAKNLVNFLYTPFLLRFVGQSSYGLFQMTNSVMLSLSLLSMGFSSAYVKFYMSYKVKNDMKSIKKLNALYLIIFLFVSVLSLIIGILLVLNTDNLFGKTLNTAELQLTRSLMIIMVLDIAITFISTVFDSNITVNEQFIFQQSRQLFQTFLIPILCIPMVLMGVGVLSISITSITVTTLFLILNMSYCIRKLNMQFDFQNLPVQLFKELGAFSFFIFLNQVVDLVNNNAPNFILGMFRGAQLVATFSIAVQIKNMFFMLSTSLSSIFIPRVNELVNLKKSREVLTNLMIKVGRIQMTILFFVLGGFIVVGKYFVRLWAGPQNMEAYMLIILMVLPAIIPLSQNIGIEIQRALNKHIFRSVVYIIFALLNVVITVIGSVKIGLIGAAIGYVVSILGANGVLMNWYYAKKMHLNMKRYWIETLKVTFPFIFTTTTLMLVQYFSGSVNSMPQFFEFGVVYVLIYSVLYFVVTANSYEKSLLVGILKK